MYPLQRAAHLVANHGRGGDNAVDDAFADERGDEGGNAFMQVGAAADDHNHFLAVFFGLDDRGCGLL